FGELPPQWVPESTDSKSPVPETPAHTVPAAVVSRLRAVTNPPSTAVPLSKFGLLEPKWAPPSTDLKRPLVVATRSTLGAGVTIRVIPLPLKVVAPTVDQVWPPSVDLRMPIPLNCGFWPKNWPEPS